MFSALCIALDGLRHNMTPQDMTPLILAIISTMGASWVRVRCIAAYFTYVPSRVF